METTKNHPTQGPRRQRMMTKAPVMIGLCDFPVEMTRFSQASEVYGYSKDTDADWTIYRQIRDACYQSAAQRAASMIRLILIGVK